MNNSTKEKEDVAILFKYIIIVSFILRFTIMFDDTLIRLLIIHTEGNENSSYEFILSIN